MSIHFHLLFPAFWAFFFALRFPSGFHLHLNLLTVVAIPPPTLSDELAIALPPIIAGISRCLRGSGLPRWLNILLAIVSLLGIAVFCAWQTDGFTDFRQSTLVVLGFMTFLAGGSEMVSLFNYLETNPSPLLAVIPAANQVATVPIPVTVMTPITTKVPDHAAVTEPQPIILPLVLPSTVVSDAAAKIPPTA